LGPAGVLRRAVLALALLAGCGSDEAAIREVEHRPEAVTPEPARFELVETAAIATGTAEVWFPLASSEAGVQEIERLDVTIKPDGPYEIEADARGNRTLHVRGAALISVTYRASCSRPVPDLPPTKPPAPVDPRLFPDELAPTDDPALAHLREEGIPARHAAGVAVEGGAKAVSWVEVFKWGCWQPPSYDHWEPILVVAHGKDRALPRAHVDGALVEPSVELAVREIH